MPIHVPLSVPFVLSVRALHSRPPRAARLSLEPFKPQILARNVQLELQASGTVCSDASSATVRRYLQLCLDLLAKLIARKRQASRVWHFLAKQPQQQMPPPGEALTNLSVIVVPVLEQRTPKQLSPLNSSPGAGPWPWRGCPLGLSVFYQVDPKGTPTWENISNNLEAPF